MTNQPDPAAQAAAEDAVGTFQCPICGEDTPHRHSDEDVAAYRAWEIEKSEKLILLAREQGARREKLQMAAQRSRSRQLDWLLNYDKNNPCEFCRDLPRGPHDLKRDCDWLYGLSISESGESARC